LLADFVALELSWLLASPTASPALCTIGKPFKCAFLLLIKHYQAYELSVLTGTQVLLLVVSETGLVYTFTTPKLQPLVTKAEGKNLIQVSYKAIRS
jgi:hypothetical protein